MLVSFLVIHNFRHWCILVNPSIKYVFVLRIMVRQFRKLSIHGWNFVIQVSCKRIFLRYQIFKTLLNQLPTCLGSFSVSLSTNVLLKFFCYSGDAYIWEAQFYTLHYWNEKSISVNYLWFIDSVTTIIIMYVHHGCLT